MGAILACPFCATQKVKKIGVSLNQPYYINLGMTFIRSNTIHSVWPKPPPARREGSSELFAMRSIKSPRNAIKRETNDSAVGQIVRFSLSGLYFSDKTVLRLPCAGGGRVLAAERAMLRIAC